MQRQAKILLIDDDPDFVSATKAVLENKYQVITAYNGDDGLKKVVDEKPDLIILDVVMPGKDGFTVCKELKGNPHYYFFSKIPVLLLTVFPHGIGSSVGAYTIYSLKKNNSAPSAMICTDADLSVVSGCALANIPMVIVTKEKFDSLQDGEEFSLDSESIKTL